MCPKTAQNIEKLPKLACFHDFHQIRNGPKTHIFIDFTTTEQDMTSGRGWEPRGQHIIHICPW